MKSHRKKEKKTNNSRTDGGDEKSVSQAAHKNNTANMAKAPALSPDCQMFDNTVSKLPFYCVLCRGKKKKTTRKCAVT